MITFKFWLKTLFFLVIYFQQPFNLYTQTTPLIKISGYVIDSATRRPIENVNVFLSFTTLGDVTGKNGLFSIKRVPVGHYDLIVSMMGYETVNKRISLTESGIKYFNFDLKVKIIKTKGIEVSATVPKGWKKILGKFERFFLGDSENASYCTILNPEYLDFDFHPDTDLFSASSNQPIIVVNKALGYKITINLIDFKAKSYSQINYMVTAKFDTLFAEDEKENKRWLKNRKKTYLGSVRHFLASLAANTLDEEDFSVYEIVNINIDYQKELKGKNILFAGKSDYERILSFKNYLKVIYQRELEPNEYAPYNRYARKYQTSLIKMSQDSVVFTIDGLLYKPYSITRYGYWGWERAAEMLPLNFKPIKEEK